jgi:hypothetical protein
MAIQHPTSITQAIGLAKLEAKIKDSKIRPPKPYNQYTYPNYTKPPTTTTPPAPPTSSLTGHNPTQVALPTKTNPSPNSKLPIKRLNQAQVQERRAIGLCYNCDEKFIPGHKCSTSRFLLLLIEDETDPLDDHKEPNQPEENHPNITQPDPYFHLSTQAVTGKFSPQTLRFKGLIRGELVMVLIDTGSTHNILQPRIATQFNLPTEPIPNFSVMVGNGNHLACHGMCPNVPITLQQAQLDLPFYLLPIKGANVVLGMVWLETLGPIQADFSIPSLTFNHHNEPITLIGIPKYTPTQSTFTQLCHLVHTNSIASFHLLTFQQLSNNPTDLSITPYLPKATNTSFNKEVETLLSHYPTVFNTPHGLPPSRAHDHRIPLLPNTTPVNVKPYRYPHSQKDTMTTLIRDMLAEGTIVPSTSPFSSPVLLVK